MSAVFVVSGLLFFVVLLGFAVTCFVENEQRAGRIMVGMSLGLVVFWFAFGILFAESTLVASIISWIFVLTCVGFLWLPLGKSEGLRIAVDKTQRYDERHVIFGRMDLNPEVPQYEEYYSTLNPGMKRFDDHLRTMPGLGDPGSEHANHMDSPYIKAIFKYIDGFNHLADPGEPEVDPVEITPEEAWVKR